ncbi:DUF7482 domain-containing protein [Flavobacterium sp.]|uniref:DUF7482 domain-containing protein n=1 Tax=Flavobacterium sp. TaxID=239 RepID=UPI003D0F7C18
MKKLLSFSTLALGFMFLSCSNNNDKHSLPETEKQNEARQLLATSALEGGRAMYEPGKGVNFRVQDSVYVKSALAIKLSKNNATVTLPLFIGISPNGKNVYYIITDASDYNIAKQMGVNYSPKLVNAIGSGGEQYVTIENGHMKFKGNVDFSPNLSIVPGNAPDYFPPQSYSPGAIADTEWSSIVVLPSGQVLNAQMVSNDTGNHDRLVAIDKNKMSVILSILDGFRGGKEYFFHLVTDATDNLPATLEKGVSASRLAKIPAFGKSLPTDKSAFLGFSPNANGITDISTGQGQGFSYSIHNAGVDPINVFPLAPKNEESSLSNNYSPLWDAHVSKWTAQAFTDNKVRRITSIQDQKNLIAQGYLTSLAETGEVNSFTGLRPVNLMINCPVIAHPSSVE